MAILFIMPFFVLYSIFTIFPVFQGIYVSLCNWNLMGKASFVGIENYKKMMQDKNFYLSCIHTVKICDFFCTILGYFIIYPCIIGKQSRLLPTLFKDGILLTRSAISFCCLLFGQFCFCALPWLTKWPFAVFSFIE